MNRAVMASSSLVQTVLESGLNFEGNIDMVGRLCLEMAEIRKSFDKQAALVKGLQIRCQELENKLEETRSHIRRNSLREENSNGSGTSSRPGADMGSH